MHRTLFIALTLTIPPVYAGECNCIVIPDATGKHQIKCDVPAIIVFTNTMPVTTPPGVSIPYTQPITPIKPVTTVPPVKPVVKPTPTQPPQGGTVGYDPITNQWIWK